MPCLRAKKWTYVKACYRMELDKEEPCMKIVNTEEFNALMNEDAVLVDFFATWCGPCKMMSPVIDEIANETQETLKVCKVNVDDELELARKFNIMSIPTFVAIKEGKVIGTTVGVQTKQQILDLLK